MTGSHFSRRATGLLARTALVAITALAVLAGFQGLSRDTFALSFTVVNLLDDAHVNDTNGNGFPDGVEVASTTCDSDPGAAVVCTLRAALFAAASNGDTADTISFDASLSGTIALETGTGGAFITGAGTLPLGACGNLIAGASCGTNAVVDSTTVDGRTGSPDPIIIIDCDTVTTGFTVTGASNTIRDLNIIDCDTAAIVITGEAADSNKVLGNYIGTNVTGTACSTANGIGVWIDSGGDSNQIGTATAADRNVISCNVDGVGISGAGTGGPGALANVVRNNYIGTNDTGTASLPNSTEGVDIAAAASTNSIIGNLISGNSLEGIEAANSGGLITGNTIGLASDGSTVLGNSSDGIALAGASGYTIGGTTAADRNVISGNGDDGIELSGAATSNTILGNYIGTDSTGNSARGNTSFGVLIANTSSGNLVGGLRTQPLACTVGPCNVLAGNVSATGVAFHDTASNNDAQGNNIGIGADGLTIVGNLYGVFDASTTGNRVGGTAGTLAGSCLGVCNRIAHNSQDGVGVTGSATLIRRNEFFGNGGFAIDLDDDDAVDCKDDSLGGVHATHTTDPTANGGITACPIMTGAVYGGGKWTVTGSDGGTAGVADVPAGSPVDIYEVVAEDAGGHGEGKRWLATTTTAGDGSWVANVCVTGPTKISAVISDLSTGRSSEFGPNFALSTGTCELAPPPTATSTPSNTPPPTATPTRTNTPTITLTPTLTSTPTSTPTATNTPVPPTATFTPVPPTATPTNTNTPTNTPTRTFTPTPEKDCGDVNDDERVNSVDAALILQLVADIISALDNPESGDVDGSGGDPDAIDASLILQKDAAIIDQADLTC